MRKLIYTATPVSAEQALSWGLVTEIADNLLNAAMELAAEIAGRSPSAIKAAKRLMALDETASDNEILLAESQEQAALVVTAEKMEVVAAMLQKRPAVF